MGKNKLEQLEKGQFDAQSVVNKLKSSVDAWASKEEIIAILKLATKYLEDPKEVEDFEDYLSSKIYNKVAELPWIWESLVNVMTNPTFFQAKNEYNRHMHAGRVFEANKFLEKMKATAKSDEEREYIKDL